MCSEIGKSVASSMAPSGTVSTCRKGKLRGGKLRPVETDLSEVVDFLDERTWQGLNQGVVCLHNSDLNRRVFGLENHPGIRHNVLSRTVAGCCHP
jgi:hypothetical protein